MCHYFSFVSLKLGLWPSVFPGWYLGFCRDSAIIPQHNPVALSGSFRYSCKHTGTSASTAVQPGQGV